MISSTKRILNKFSKNGSLHKFSTFGNYQHALMRDIDIKLPQEALCINDATRINLDYDKAIIQHQELTNVMRNCGVSIHTLSSNDCPDSVFIEDTAIILNDRALMTKPGALARRKEVDAVRTYFNLNFKGKINTVELPFQDGTLDGGDVLYTGKEFIVGESNRTNKLGVMSLQIAFPHIPVYYVSLNSLLPQSKNPDSSTILQTPLHLKSFCSMYGPNHMLVGGTLGGQFADWLLASRTKENSAFYLLQETFPFFNDNPDFIKQIPLYQSYELLSLPDMEAANAVYINNNLIVRSSEEFPISIACIREKIPTSNFVKEIFEVNASELSKVDGALTCCSLLF